jgi:uncharacterized protein YerC
MPVNANNYVFVLKDVDEAWKILSALDQKLSVEIKDLNNRVDGQKLLNELHRYNEIKDSAQIVIGSLANVQGVTVAKLHSDLNLDADS